MHLARIVEHSQAIPTSETIDKTEPVMVRSLVPCASKYRPEKRDPAETRKTAMDDTHPTSAGV
jgi:hypothetical protein